MSSNHDHYWACSACDSGGHPLTAAQAFEGSQAHMERSGHVVVRGAIKEAS